MEQQSMVTGPGDRRGLQSPGTAISNAVVAVLREYVGRGPTMARTIINRDVVVVLMRDTLTRAEAKLVEAGDGDIVHLMRHKFQMSMREALNEAVEQLTGRKVIAFMSGNHLDPDLAAEIFVMDGPVSWESSLEPDASRIGQDDA